METIINNNMPRANSSARKKVRLVADVRGEEKYVTRLSDILTYTNKRKLAVFLVKESSGICHCNMNLTMALTLTMKVENFRGQADMKRIIPALHLKVALRII